MYIVTQDEIRRLICIQLQVLPNYVQRDLNIRGERAARTAAEQIARRVFTGTVTVRPDLVEAEHRPGEFGRDEPHPFPELVREA